MELLAASVLSSARTIGITVYVDGHSGATMRWSEVGPAVVPVQIIVSVTIARDSERATGFSSATRYEIANELKIDWRVIETKLETIVGGGATPWRIEHLGQRNPYEEEVGVDVLVEIAYLDALGRLVGIPSSAFLGGSCRDEVPVYASLPSFSSIEAMIDCARNAVDDGYSAVKFHATGFADFDARAIRIARSALGDKVTLIWDGGSTYNNLYDALLVGSALEEATYLWFEAPVRDDAGLVRRELARRLRIPLVPDASALRRSPGDLVLDAIDGVWGALRVDATRAPSITDAIRIVRAAESLGLPCEIQSFGHGLGQFANLGLISTTMSCRFFEVPYPDPSLGCAIGGPTVVNGKVRIPNAPGFGFTVDQSIVDTAWRRVVDIRDNTSGLSRCERSQ